MKKKKTKNISDFSLIFFFFFFHSDGKCLACTYRAKYIEVSVGINHNVDELLAGTLTQIRLKKEQNALQVSKHSKQYLSKYFICYKNGYISKIIILLFCVLLALFVCLLLLSIGSTREFPIALV